MGGVAGVAHQAGTMHQAVSEFDFDRAAAVFSYEPVHNKNNCVISKMFSAVNQVELGLFKDGIEDEEPNWELNGELDELEFECEDCDIDCDYWFSADEEEGEWAQVAPASSGLDAVAALSEVM